MIRKGILAKEMTQGAVPIGIPAAYKYDAAYAEAAAAKAADAISQIDREGQIYVDRATAQAAAAATSAEAAAKIVDVGVDPTLTVSGAAADSKTVGDRLKNDKSGISKLKDDIERLNEENQQQTKDMRNIMTAVEKKDVYLVDSSENHLANNENNYLVGGVYLPVTDKTLSASDVPADAAEVGKLKIRVGNTFLDTIGKTKYREWEFPVLYLNGVTDELTNENAGKGVTLTDVSYSFPKFNIAGTLEKMKVQGSSSVNFPKKNYTLTFDKNIQLVDGWGHHKKYVIKSNFNDFSQSRNVCNARLWGSIRKTRVSEACVDKIIDHDRDILSNSNGDTLIGCADKQLSIGLDYGAIDGFPIQVVINDKYWGLYCFTIPKDDWMARMDGPTKQCIVSTDYSSTNASRFKGLATMQESENGLIDFEIEYNSKSFKEDKILSSINMAISAAMESHSTAQEYIDSISPYIDINSVIDYYILTVAIGNTDGWGKNYLLQTWDGIKWYMAAYDLDLTHGNPGWEGFGFADDTVGSTFKKGADQHRLMHIIYQYARENLISRYEELRESVLSESNMYYVFGKYIGDIPKSAYDYECLRWPGTPMTSVKNFDQIVNWYRLRCIRMDAEIAVLKTTL